MIDLKAPNILQVDIARKYTLLLEKIFECLWMKYQMGTIFCHLLQIKVNITSNMDKQLYRMYLLLRTYFNIKLKLNFGIKEILDNLQKNII